MLALISTENQPNLTKKDPKDETALDTGQAQLANRLCAVPTTAWRHLAAGVHSGLSDGRLTLDPGISRPVAAIEVN